MGVLKPLRRWLQLVLALRDVVKLDGFFFMVATYDEKFKEVGVCRGADNTERFREIFLVLSIDPSSNLELMRRNNAWEGLAWFRSFQEPVFLLGLGKR